MILAHRLMKLRPGCSLKDFIIQNDGEGDYIKEWVTGEYTQPTQVEIDSVDDTPYVSAEEAATGYIPARKKAYIATMKKRNDDGPEEVLGYVVDILLTEIEAMKATTAQTQEYTDLVAGVAAVKAAIPKP